MKQILSIILVLSCMLAKAQYGNEWIDYGKTYYKFKLAKDGVYRISQTSLQTIGLGNTPAEQFQLWRNGVQVPMHTSVASGALGGAGFIEFWGEMNDGKPDKNLYHNINFQLSDKWSLETDSASYFLTVNPEGNNLRFATITNNVNGSPLTPEAYFMHTEGLYFKTKINAGYAGIVGEYVYSSVYDKGEGYTSDDIYPGGALSQTINTPYPYAGGPDGIFYIAAAGNANNNRTLRARVNNTQLVDATMDSFNDQKQQVSLPAALLSTGTAKVDMINTSANPNDRMVVSKFEITYARQFNFGGASNFVFSLAANGDGNLLRISNFNGGTAIPVLYDLTNYTRYEGNTGEAGFVRFALLPSAQKRKLVLVSEEASNINNINTFVARNFINYAQESNQGDYIIISNPLLYSGPNGNPVEAYRQYRSSGTGGGYNAKIYDIDQLTDQFAWGIKRHPFAVKSFIKYATDVFQADPRAILLIGKGVSYNQARQNESNALLDRINLIPPFGYPASDNLLAARDKQTIADIPLGRISAVTPTEVEVYLDKVKEYESIGVNAPQTIAGRGWMKNIVHAIGGGDADLSAQIGGYMNQLKNIIQDTLYGGHVKSFSKTSAVASQLTSEGLKSLFAEGIGVLNYFGHSSASTIEFNIDDPMIYQNHGKYPVFLVNGCLAGDIFNFEADRLNSVKTLSEKYIMAKDRGGVAFIASTHFGIVNYLNTYLKGIYQAIAEEKYGHNIGETLEESFRYLTSSWAGDYFARLHAEEITLHGDPAVRLYTQTSPDYVIEDQLIVIPSLISVADNNFTVSAKYFNLGKAESDSFFITVKRQIPDGSTSTVFQKRVLATKSTDSIKFLVQINPAMEKGENKLIFTLDSDGEINEISETNNSITKVFYIVDDGAKPVYPYNFSIVNDANVSFYVSTANPLAPQRNYVMEIDTTELFNSPGKKSLTVAAPGGIVEFNPSISLLDSTVYYWRTALQSDELIWNTSSFIYLQNGSSGYNQSHYFQFQKNSYIDLLLEGDRRFRYDGIPKTLKITTGLYPYYVNDQISVTLDEEILDSYGCMYSSLQFVVYDSNTLRPWPNSPQPGGFGRFGSASPCGHNNNAFEFKYSDTSFRRKAVEFFESIPAGTYISVTNLGMSSNTSFIDDWKKDTLKLGKNRSLYHILKNQGLSDIDLFTTNKPFLFFFKKDDPNYPAKSIIGPNENTRISQSFDLISKKTVGEIASVWFGPAKQWDKLIWNGANLEEAPDNVTVRVRGRDNNGNETVLATVKSSRDTALSFIDAKQYPYLKLEMNNKDTIHGTPHQLSYWRLIGKLPPEGAIAPNLFLSGGKDTVEVGEKLVFGIAFKNISPTDFDSLKVKLTLLDKNNVQHELDISKKKPLVSGDTVKIQFEINTQQYPGLNTLFVSFNPDNDQPEQYFLNNFLYKNFYVKPDTFNPLMDVTFDGVHILDKDIVSAKPHIVVKLKDDNKHMVLDDTSLIKIQVQYPNGVYRTFSFNNDTLRFTVPSVSADGKTDNTATIDFNPAFLEDGDYSLVVSGRDKSGNNAGQTEYRVSFKIINKPMISNLFNYPNPFTTSTAFVFTLTGSEVPQNLRIQILTITGKIVRELTKQELGEIRIGRNITEYKWDGTDQYGQKLANGVYLYRVITNLNGKSLDKYKTEGDNTDQYFNKGYGKMYLMR